MGQRAKNEDGGGGHGQSLTGYTLNGLLEGIVGFMRLLVDEGG